MNCLLTIVCCQCRNKSKSTYKSRLQMYKDCQSYFFFSFAYNFDESELSSFITAFFNLELFWSDIQCKIYCRRCLTNCQCCLLFSFMSAFLSFSDIIPPIGSCRWQLSLWSMMFCKSYLFLFAMFWLTTFTMII